VLSPKPELTEITNDNRSMAKASVASRRRAEALTWLIGLGARQPVNIIRARADAWFRNRRGHSGRGIALADRAALRATNPALVALRQRYAGLQDLIGTAPFWRAGYVAEQDLLYFRGDNCYVWQFQDNNTSEKYVLTYLYLKASTRSGFLTSSLKPATMASLRFQLATQIRRGITNSSAATSWTRSVSCYFSNGRCKSRVGRVEGARYRRGIRQARVPCCDSAEQY